MPVLSEARIFLTSEVCTTVVLLVDMYDCETVVSGSIERTYLQGAWDLVVDKRIILKIDDKNMVGSYALYYEEVAGCCTVIDGLAPLKNLRGLSQRENYTDRATAACRRSTNFWL
jgi:hypothetical protein